MDNRPIGIFDSGLGGLNGLRALRRFLPDENIVYFADSGRLPYGAKSRPQLRGMAKQDLRFLSSFDVKAILIACGTLSSNAGDILAGWPIPTVGVLTSSADWMRRLEGSGPIAVIATEASIRSGSYQSALHEACPTREVVAIPCPDFVPLIESGHCSAEDPAVRDAVSRYLQPAREAGAEALLLGCTHYDIIGDAISRFLGPDITLHHAGQRSRERCGGPLFPSSQGRPDRRQRGDPFLHQRRQTRLFRGCSPLPRLRRRRGSHRIRSAGADPGTNQSRSQE